jgi:cell surface protein SprA
MRSHEPKKQPQLSKKNDVKIHRGALDYQFNTQPKYIKPFDKLIKKGKYLQWIKEFNFNPVPSSVTVRNEINRQFGEIKYRFTGDSPYSTFFDKRFTWDRNYGLQWNLAQNLNLSFTALNNAVIDEPFGRLDTQLERDTVINNLKKFGRPKNYNHTASASYTLPTKKIPILDWMNIRGQYNTNFKWAAASLNADTLGNVLQNGMTWSVNGDFNLVNFYNKSKYLKKINTPPSKKEIEDRKKGKQPTTQPTTPDKQNDNSLTDDAVTTPKPDDKKNKEDKKKKEHIPSVAERILLRPIMMLRNVKVNYSEAYTSIIPGYTPRTRILGQNPDFTAPGWDYAFGIQPNSKWLDNGAQQGWFTTNPYLNQQVQQTYTQTADGKVTLEPFRDFRIDVDANRTYSKNHSEFFKVFDPDKGFQHLIPQQVGSLSVSYLPIRTLFTSKSDSTLTENFRTFENNRQVISDRLGLLNPASGGSHPTDNGYAEGYGRYQQDVLIPAFIAAYSGQDASKVNLNIFNTIPLPNWRLSYNGLSKVGKLNKVFETITLSHGYSSKLTVNSFKTNLNFDDQYDLLTPSTQSYYARYEIPDVVITESFSPLIGIDTRLKNDVSLKFEYKKSRNLNMSFTDYQLVESQTTDLTFGAGYRIKNVKFPIKLSFGKTKQTITNDVNLKLDFSVRDDITINHLLDQNQSLPTRGLKTIRISPTADYSISQQLSLRLFFDYSRTMPATAQQFPITNAKGGLTIRFALTQ